MNKLVCVILIFILNVSASKKLGRKLSGNFSWQYTMTEDELMLIRNTNSDNRFQPYVKFNANYTFTDTRSASCGNDIIYNKKGKYFLSSKQLIMNYTGGTFSDNVGGNSKQVYVLGKVIYKVNRITTDTLFLTRLQGNSEKRVSLTEDKN